ncbi:MAG: hypothetical protein GXO78_10870 [Calditrichaeota bacterium]|nr:hypothetical protein [Calditrichota bacterium]
MQFRPGVMISLGLLMVTLVAGCVSVRLVEDASLPDLIIQRAHVHKRSTPILRGQLFPAKGVSWAEYTIEVQVYNRGVADWVGPLYLGMTQTNDDFLRNYFAKFVKLTDDDFVLPPRQSQTLQVKTALANELRFLRLIISYRADVPRLEDGKEFFTNNNEYTLRLR